MHHHLSAMLDGTVRLDDEELDVVGAWLDPEDVRLRYLVLDLGGWMSNRTALLAAGALTPRDDGRWTTAVTRAEVEAAEGQPESGFRLDMSALPMILTGPFGNTISPMLMAAGLRSEAVEEGPPSRPGMREDSGDAPPAISAEAKTRSLERWEAWRGAPVFARDGEIGPLGDLMLDDIDWRPVRAIVTTRHGPVGLPWELMRRRVQPGGHIVMALDIDHVTSAPDGLDPGTEADAALRAHYGY